MNFLLRQLRNVISAQFAEWTPGPLFLVFKPFFNLMRVQLPLFQYFSWISYENRVNKGSGVRFGSQNELF